MAKNTLRKADLQSEAWTRMKEWIAERRNELRFDLESDDCSERTTSKLRGRIAQLTELLALEKAPATVQRTGDRLSADAPEQPFEADPQD